MTSLTRREVVFLSAVLILMGAGWGMTQPLTKIAVSTGYRHFGLIFWQLVIGAVFMAVVCTLRGVGLPRGMHQVRICLIVALIGTVLPNTTSFQAAVHLPSGILSILLSMIPMWAFPIALFMGNDSFSWRRLLGLTFGLGGVLLIAAPGADALNLSLFWIVIGLVSGLCYAVEGNVVAKMGTSGLDPFQVLYGASLMGAVMVLPLMVLSGQWIAPFEALTREGQAHVAGSVIHVIVYSGYVWMVGRAGSVFAVQVSYLVTGFGVLWAMLLLGEGYPPGIWAALALMFLGMYLVQPRAKAALAPARPIDNTAS